MQIDLTPPDLTQDNRDADSVLRLLKVATVDTPGEYRWACGALKEVAAKLAQLESSRKAITDPLNKAKKEVDNLFKPVTSALKEADILLRALVVHYQTCVTAARDKALQEGNTTDLQKYDVPETEGVGTLKTWEGIVTDPNLVPRAYLIPDIAKLKAATSNGDPKIPGWEVVQKISLRVAKK